MWTGTSRRVRRWVCKEAYWAGGCCAGKSSKTTGSRRNAPRALPASVSLVHATMGAAFFIAWPLVSVFWDPWERKQTWKQLQWKWTSVSLSGCRPAARMSLKIAVACLASSSLPHTWIKQLYVRISGLTPCAFICAANWIHWIKSPLSAKWPRASCTSRSIWREKKRDPQRQGREKMGERRDGDLAGPRRLKVSALKYHVVGGV